jgi:uncharacterized protein (DUF1330 family)
LIRETEIDSARLILGRSDHAQRILDYLLPLGSNPAALTAYGTAAGPAITAGGARLLVRGTPAKAYEAGLNQRCVLIEFDSLEKAIATYESPEYQAAKKLLEGSVERDVRMVEGAQ